MDLKARLNELHDRMLAGSRTASRDLFVTALNPLMRFLSSRFPSLSDDDLYDLASDTILIYITNPQGCDRAKSSLWSYLCRIARTDAIDLLRKTTKREELLSENVENDVEFWASRTNDVSRDEDAIDARRIMSLYGHKLATNETEAKVLALILNDENRTSEFAQALGLDLIAPDAEEMVKKVKDRLLLRMKRLRDELS